MHSRRTTIILMCCAALCVFAVSLVIGADIARSAPRDHRADNLGSTFTVHVAIDAGVARDGAGVAVSDTRVLIPYALVESCRSACKITVKKRGFKDEVVATLVPTGMHEDPVFALLKITPPKTQRLSPVRLAARDARTWQKLYMATPKPRALGFETRNGRVRNPKSNLRDDGAQEDWTGLVVTDAKYEPGSIGAGLYDARSGALLGMVYGTYERNDSPINGMTVAFSASVIREFLIAKGLVPVK